MALHALKNTEFTDMKKRIVREAKAMFMEIGYDNTTVNALLDRMKIAKGTFYHYFTSKEELLNSVVKDFSDGIMAELDVIMSEETDAFTKLNRVLSVGRQRKVENMELMKMLMAAMYRPENLILRNRILQVTVSASAELLEKIIKQGDREGIFRSVGGDSGMLIMSVGVALSDTMVGYVMKKDKTPEDHRRMREMAETYDRAVARLLGIEEGKISLIDREFLEALKQG